MKVAFDTNILAYAESTNGVELRDESVDLIQRLPSGAVVLSVQALGELFNVLVKKAKRPAAAARTAMLTWGDAYPLADTASTVMINAADPCGRSHRWNLGSVIIAAAAEAAGCRLLVSADLHKASRGVASP